MQSYKGVLFSLVTTSMDHLVLSPTLELQLTNKFVVLSLSKRKHEPVLAFVQLNCDYSREILLKSLRRRPWCTVIEDEDEQEAIRAAGLNGKKIIQFADFENIKWDGVMNGDEMASSFLVRKGLSRKAQLALQLKKYNCKHPNSLLKTHIPLTVIVETWSAFENMRLNFGGMFANFDASSTSMTLRQKLDFILEDLKDEVEAPGREGWYWIMKPSVTNKGQNIAIARNYEEILDELEINPDIREWVVQRYVPNPLLVGGHKFHFRVYVLCVGALNVYVFDHILMLLAAHRYRLRAVEDIHCHLTNTARAAELDNFDEEAYVKLMDDLPEYLVKEHPHLASDIHAAEAVKQKLLDDIHSITAETFAAFENEYTVFAPMSNCFELYGLDFIVDDQLNVSLLEINPGPDFKQTGDRLRKVIVEMWEQTCALVIEGEGPEETPAEAAIRESNPCAKMRHLNPEARGHRCNGAPDFTRVYAKTWSAAGMKGGMGFSE